ncbi:membrane protein [Kocuria varians]|uniref:Membrane protein n=1 Tax=Kocuria varians TaxID=1272 RepID=A0A4Y4D7T4_KOCVA|nr:PH domain-containing protein [Kocuria varians]GEC98810.1 membrane protein [Kocuria varians]
MPATNDPQDLAPAQLSWQRVAPRYVTVRLLNQVVSTVVWTAIASIPVLLVLLRLWDGDVPWWLWLPPAVVVLWGLVKLVLIPRRVRAIGYAEAPTELWLRKGLLFRTVTVVPYGRMQYVEISTGPVLNAFGLASVTLHTASAGTDAVLPGLPRAEADRLREQLTERGEAHMVGL